MAQPTKVKKSTKRTAQIKHLAAKKPAPTSSPFMQTRITEQTIYWLIFGAVAIIFTLWLYSLDAKVRDLYDQVDANTYSIDAIDPIAKKQ